MWKLAAGGPGGAYPIGPGPCRQVEGPLSRTFGGPQHSEAEAPVRKDPGLGATGILTSYPDWRARNKRAGAPLEDPGPTSLRSPLAPKAQ
jgi:hypothetical protein